MVGSRVLNTKKSNDTIEFKETLAMHNQVECKMSFERHGFETLLNRKWIYMQKKTHKSFPTFEFKASSINKWKGSCYKDCIFFLKNRKEARPNRKQEIYNEFTKLGMKLIFFIMTFKTRALKWEISLLKWQDEQAYSFSSQAKLFQELLLQKKMHLMGTS